jgi:hypothetical protein
VLHRRRSDGPAKGCRRISIRPACRHGEAEPAQS